MESNIHASLLGCYWFHVIMFLHDVTVLDLHVWTLFQLAVSSFIISSQLWHLL